MSCQFHMSKMNMKRISVNYVLVVFAAILLSVFIYYRLGLFEKRDSKPITDSLSYPSINPSEVDVNITIGENPINTLFDPCNGTYLNARGNKLFDSAGNIVRLTSTSWFGFESANRAPHGLWVRDCKSMLIQIKDLGFNSIRLPWSDAILEPGATVSGIKTAKIPDAYTGRMLNEVEGTLKSPLELLDLIVDYCQELNLKIILDNHSRQSEGNSEEKFWYTDQNSHEKWIGDWVFLAARYRDKDTVVAMDLNNEPHGNNGSGSRWGNDDPRTDWALAAQTCGNAILRVNPNVLIMVEGVEEYQDETYWWGGNLKGVKEDPILLSNPYKLMYSPHEFGPTVFNQKWFSDPDFPDNMEEIWENYFNYLHTEEISPLYVGEFAIKDPGGKEEVWFNTFIAFMGEKGYSWSYRCWNPNSSNTGGILTDDWTTINEWKMKKLRPYLAPEIPNKGEVNEDCKEINHINANAGNGVSVLPKGTVNTS